MREGGIAKKTQQKEDDPQISIHTHTYCGKNPQQILHSVASWNKIRKKRKRQGFFNIFLFEWYKIPFSTNAQTKQLLWFEGHTAGWFRQGQLLQGRWCCKWYTLSRLCFALYPSSPAKTFCSGYTELSQTVCFNIKKNPFVLPCTWIPSYVQKNKLKPNISLWQKWLSPFWALNLNHFLEGDWKAGGDIKTGWQIPFFSWLPTLIHYCYFFSFLH